MSAELIVFLLIGAAAGGFINGLAGFGTSLFALGWWLQVIPPLQAVALALIMSVCSGIQGVYIVRHAIHLLYGGFFILKRDLPTLARPMPAVDMVTGFLGGILGAIAGLSGALPTMWLSMRDWSKAESRAVLQPYNVAVLSLSAIMLAFSGAYTRNTLLLIGIALPATMIAAQMGIRTYDCLSDTQFRRLLIAMLMLSGIILLIQESLS